ncbi:Uncharacterized protein Fot_14115 [Forsythia ovata]|uniref:EGF-like domain-containing protein n=1 Tax=Forsythia ovata TaxID=205694 RepID=A0ABD1W5N5_9LAMI
MGEQNPTKRAIGNQNEFRQPGAIKAALAEFFSTLIFVFVGEGSGMAYNKLTGNAPNSPSGLVAAAVAHGFRLFVAVSISANISGGHVNPSVTFGLFLGGNISLFRGILYIIAQLLGSGMAYNKLTGNAPNSPSGLVAAAVAHGFRLFVAVSISANISGGHVNPSVTFGLFLGGNISLLYNKLTGNAPNSPSGLVAAAVAHGFRLFVAVSISANISGGHVNPSITFGLFLGGNISLFRGILYIIAQLLGSVIACLLLWFSTGGLTLNNSINTLPGCQSKCGNLTVPYPFGIGINAGCSIDPWFDINCDTSFNPPKAFLSKTNNQEVIDISGTKIRLKNYIASKCYNNIGGMTQENSVEVDLGTSPFSFSNENKFTVVGCDYFWLIEGKVLLHNSISSCFASCSYSIQLSDESCSGIGCCQTYIPKGLKRFTISQGTLLNNTKVFSYNPCGYSFLGEQDRYKFRVSDLFNPIFPQRILKNVPLVIDWVIGNKTCVEVQKSSDFACQENSICVDSDTGLEGYRCNCSNGYEGNPYLRPGCQG